VDDATFFQRRLEPALRAAAERAAGRGPEAAALVARAWASAQPALIDSPLAARRRALAFCRRARWAIRARRALRHMLPPARLALVLVVLLLGAPGPAALVQEAQARGWNRTLADADASRLRSLGAAALAIGRLDLATGALAAQRARFRGTSVAHAAAFDLGLLAETLGRAPERALGWYERYLVEAPGGPLAAAARARRQALVATYHGRAGR
jgi:hypothetical protein